MAARSPACRDCGQKIMQEVIQKFNQTPLNKQFEKVSYLKNEK